MNATTALLRMIAATMPHGVRDRYREEWLADATGASELGMSSADVIGAAIMTAVRIDHNTPAVAGMTIRTLAARRSRWGLALMLSGVMLLLGTWLLGVIELVIPAVIGLALGVVIFARGVVLLLAIPRLLAWSATLAGTLLTLAAGGFAAVTMVIPASMLLPASGLLTPLVALTGPAPTGRRRALLTGVLGALAVLAVVATGLLHVLVWNPLAKLPGFTLDEIYAGLSAAGELPSPIVMITWALFGVLSAAALMLCAAAPGRRLRAAASTRRLLRMSIATVAAVALSVWVAGFGMGMGMADAFAMTGGDAAGTGTALTAIGLAGAMLSALLALVPGPPPQLAGATGWIAATTCAHPVNGDCT